MLLAPLYDFGPSFLDARAIPRVIRWDAEEAGRTDRTVVLENLATRFEEANVDFDAWPALLDSMQAFAEQLETLPALMTECDVEALVVDLRQAEMERLARELRAIRVR